MKAIIGQKVKMTQVFSKDGERFPVTEIVAGPCPVLFEKTVEKDGYLSLGLGWGIKKNRKGKKIGKENKESKGINTKGIKETEGQKEARVENKPLFLREIRINEEERLPVGEIITVDKVLEAGDLVDVTGISKGFGFTGVVKRYHFKGGPRTHGQSDRERAPGSIGQATTPGRVYKGKRMAGKEGGKRKTIKNLLVVKVDPSQNKVILKGSIPGKNKGLLIIKKTGERAKVIKEF